MAPYAPPSVLVIDDDPLALGLVGAILTSEGFRVRRAASGSEGLALAERALPALVICDLLMPEMDGFTVVERLRARPAAASIPIIILTSLTMTAEDKARLNGHISYLARKSEFDRVAFVALVRALCPLPAGG